MFVVVQLPMVDARVFAPRTAPRLPVPDWPEPIVDVHPQFVRRFGSAQRRRRGVEGNWVDEAYYVDARRALTVPAPRAAGGGAAMPPVSTAFRRLLVANRGVAPRLEVGLRLGGDAWGASAADVLGRVRAAVCAPTAVAPRGGTAPARALVNLTTWLPAAYARSTTPHPSQDADGAGLVLAGQPLVVAEVARFPWRDAPPWARVVDPGNTGGENLALVWLRTDFGPIRLWMLSRDLADEDRLRNLRIGLLHLHAEQEALDLLLRLFERGTLDVTPSDPTWGDLEDYLNAATRIVGAGSRGGLDQAAITAAEKASLAVGDAVSRLSRQERFERIRRQVWRKAGEFRAERDAVRTIRFVTVHEGGTYVEENSGQIVQGSTIYGSVVNQMHVQTLQDSFNTFVQNHPQQDDLRSAVQDLHAEVQKMLDQIKPESGVDVGEVVDNVQTLTEEAAKAEPRRGTVRSCAKTIADTAKAVGSAAGPVISAVGIVLKILGIPVPF